MGFVLSLPFLGCLLFVVVSEIELWRHNQVGGREQVSHQKRKRVFCFVLLENTKSRDRRVKSTTAHSKLRGHDTRRNEEKRKTRKVCFFLSFFITRRQQQPAKKQLLSFDGQARFAS